MITVYVTLFDRIRTKYSCGGWNKWCDQQIKIQNDKGGESFGVTKDNTGYIWYITKVRAQSESERASE